MVRLRPDTLDMLILETLGLNTYTSA